MIRIRRRKLLRTEPTRYKTHFRLKLNEPSTWGLLGDLAVRGSGGGGSYNVTPAVTTIGYLILELGPGVLR